MKSWRTLGWIAVAAACVLYAFLAHRAAASASPGPFDAAVLVSPLLTLALVLAWRSRHRAWWLTLWFASCAGLILATRHGAPAPQWVLLLEHGGINASLAIAFGRTLLPGRQPLISGLAAVVHGQLTPRVAAYTRGATGAWALYFGLTAAASVLLFALAPLSVWSAFTTLFSLPLLAAMFAGEYLVRILVVPRSERAGFLESIAAYREFARRKQVDA